MKNIYIVKIGDKFNRFTVLEEAPRGTSRSRKWLCQCQCGNTRIVEQSNLVRGGSKSCGCFRKDNPPNREHGLTNHFMFKTWGHIMDRCLNPKCKSYPRYGGRGITICDRWKDVRNFIADVEPLYVEGYTLDRIDNNKGYEPGNVRYASATLQANNRRSNTYLEFEGKRLTIAQWAKEKQLNYGTLLSRIYRSKWDLEEALNTEALKGINYAGPHQAGQYISYKEYLNTNE